MKISNLIIKKDNKIILDSLSAEFEPNKLHVIMGPNGSGKSTLLNTISGLNKQDIVDGSIFFNDKNLLELNISDIALTGVHLCPQHPPVIEGLSHAAFLKEALNIRRSRNGLDELDEFEFLKLLKSKASEFNFDPKTYVRQSLNSGFSGGEKKRNEILQISLLQPEFILLDELDSGLDIESMKKIAAFLKEYLLNNKTIVIVTHYPQFGYMLEPDYVHIIKNGQLKAIGDQSLMQKVEEFGFGDF